MRSKSLRISKPKLKPSSRSTKGSSPFSSNRSMAAAPAKARSSRSRLTGTSKNLSVLKSTGSTSTIQKSPANVLYGSSSRLSDWSSFYSKIFKIETLILALLGDFITNQIHDAENAETNALQPTHALVTAQNYIVSGIEFLLNHTKLKLLIPCHSGNHGRTTKTTRFTSENGHSFEYLMYLHLQTYFKGNDRVQFIIPPGMHSYVDVYGSTIRFHHGHAIKYGGGVGGIYIPVNKAIAQWNKGRHADLDVFGHFHQLRDGGNFLCNGSLIGYNGYAMSIKADYEKPRQTLFLMDKRRGRTCCWPILVEKV
jgi:hypothetical protein